MADREVRKVWSKPELRRLRAGAAEQGPSPIADGGNPTTGARS